MRYSFSRAALLMVLSTTAVAASDVTELNDPYFAEVVYLARQGDYFEAISRLDAELKQHYGVDEPQLDTLHFHINEADFSVGDFELSYRMHHKAGRALKAVSEARVAPAVRNEALYRLARLYFQKEQNIEALHAIELIEGELPDDIASDVVFLRGQIYLATGRFADAEAQFYSLVGKKGFAGFADYNLGIVQLLQDKIDEGMSSLELAGKIRGKERGVADIRDKANLLLASRFMEAGDFRNAQWHFDRVRLEGPFSNRALLGFGWAEVSQERYDRALVPWELLAGRDVTDLYVQEAMLGVPYAYGKLGLYGKSAVMYSQAITLFSAELERLDASIRSIREGRFLDALLRDEVKSDKEWVIRLRELEGAPETYYLAQLLASHDFHNALQNYLDLEALSRKLVSWALLYDAFENTVAVRRAHYEALLPSIDAQFRKLDSLHKLRLQQGEQISARLDSQLVSPRPDYLASPDEREAKARIAALEARLGSRMQQGDDPEVQRLKRLKGVLHWNIVTAYDERLDETFRNLAGLDEIIEQARPAHDAFIRTRHAVTQSYRGYDEQIVRLRNRADRAAEKVAQLMARQGHMIEMMAINELVKRREMLEQYMVKANLGLADSYDRAAKARPDAGEEDAVVRSLDDYVPEPRDVPIERWLQ